VQWLFLKRGPLRGLLCIEMLGIEDGSVLLFRKLKVLNGVVLNMDSIQFQT
jgi:hypothetical protein